MTNRAVEELRSLVHEALFEGEKVMGFCRIRRFLFWKWAIPHRWGKWNMDGRVTRGTSIEGVIYERQCRRCGHPQFKTVKYGNSQ